MRVAAAAATNEWAARLLAAMLLFAVLASAYGFSIGLRATFAASITGDEPFYLLTTQSLLQDGNLDLRRQYATESYRSFFDHPNRLWKQSIPQADGSILSPHEPGLSLLVIPGLIAAGLTGVQVELLLLAAATFALAFLLTGLETGAWTLSWLVTATVALTAPAFVYATEVYPEMPAALCVVLAILLFRSRHHGAVTAAALVAVLTALAWLGLKFVPIGCVLAVAFLLTNKGRARLVFLTLGALAGAAYLWFHLAVFGALTPYNSNTVYEGASTWSVLGSHVAFQERVYRLWGLFIDRRFGIARWAPVLLAVLPGLVLLPALRRTGLVVFSVIVAALLMASLVSVTMMGWWFPGRMLIVVYPLFPLVLTLTLLRLPQVLRVPAALAALYSLLVTVLLVRSAGAGEVAIAVNPFDMSAWPFRVAGSLFPQYTAWGADTVLLTFLWLGLGTAALLILSWNKLRRFHPQRHTDEVRSASVFQPTEP